MILRAVLSFICAQVRSTFRSGNRSTQHVFTCSKSTMETLEYNFEQILKFVLVFLLKFYFEQVNAGWVLRADFPNKP